jgi:hypothetical protein
MPLLRWLLMVLKLTALAGTSIVCGAVLWFIASLVISPTFRTDVLQSVGMASSGQFVGGSVRPAPVEVSLARQLDLDTVNLDHAEIYSWVLSCIGMINTPWLLPRETREKMVLPSLIRDYHIPFRDTTPRLSSADAVASDATPRLSSVDADPIPSLTQKERALLQLSINLGEQRLALLEKVRSSYFFWQATALVSIVIGMVTTILVSISSTEFGRGDGHNQRLLRVLAIIFPAIGTAVAAIIGFYSPQAEWSQASRSLASETQLHDQMGFGVWEITCPTTDADPNADQLTTSLKEWSKRFTDIQTIANATGAATSAQGSGGGSPNARESPATSGSTSPPGQ